MSDYSKDTIKDLIYFLVTEGYIKSIGDKYPILVLDKSANDVLFKDKKVFIKRKIEKILPNSTSPDSEIQLEYDENLFEILRTLRKNLAEINNVPPFVVFADVSLKEMATFYPISSDEMLQINGVGINKLDKYGNDFIDAISQYVSENNIEIPKRPSAPAKHAHVSKDVSSTKSKEDTKLVSYELFKSGKSIDEISDVRGLTKQTIENHLIKCYEDGMDIVLDDYIHTEFESMVFEAIKDLGFERLKPLKEALPEEVSYFDIRYFVAKYRLINE